MMGDVEGGFRSSLQKRLRYRRLLLVLLGLGVLSFAVFLMGLGLRDNIVFFHTPGDIAAGGVDLGVRFRVGGLVGVGSIEYVSSGTEPLVSFEITDEVDSVEVLYRGVLPDLFRAGQGVVALGRLDGGGVFIAEQILAKHDENYMPAEAVEALKRSGVWKGS